MLAYAEELTVELDLEREVPAFFRLLMLAYKPGRLEAAIISCLPS
jgi:hypothetical protein